MSKSEGAPSHKGDLNLSLFNIFFVYVSYVVLLCFGHLRDFIDTVIGYKIYPTPKVRNKFLFHTLSHFAHFRPSNLFSSSLCLHQGYAPLTSDFEAFYTRRMYSRIEDCWNRPISGVPGSWMDVLDRKFADETWKRDQMYVTPSFSAGIGTSHEKPRTIFSSVFPSTTAPQRATSIITEEKRHYLVSRIWMRECSCEAMTGR